MTRRRRRSRRPSWWRELTPLGKGRRRKVKHLANATIPGAGTVSRIVRRATRRL